MNEQRPLPELLGDLFQNTGQLVRQEIALARAETSEKIHQATGGLAVIGTGAVLLAGALLILLHAAVEGLVEAGLEPWAAMLIVGIATAVIGGLLLRSGLKRIKPPSLKPTKTVDQVHRDIVVVKEQFQ